MKQIKDDSVSRLGECALAMFFICISLVGQILHVCVSAADFIRSSKRRATRQADAGSISQPQTKHEADRTDAVKSFSVPSST